MFYKSTIIGEIISSIFGYFKISNTILMLMQNLAMRHHCSIVIISYTPLRFYIVWA